MEHGLSRRLQKWGIMNILLDSIINTFTNRYTVVDQYPDVVAKANEVVVKESNIIYYIGLKPEVNYTTRDYIFPVGKRVLALWPESTTFYGAEIKTRNALPVMI